MKIYVGHIIPVGGDIIFSKYIRNNRSIAPHGDTQLRYGDRLIGAENTLMN